MPSHEKNFHRQRESRPYQGGVGKRYRRQSTTFSAAVLILFAAQARAGIVATDFGTRPHGFGFCDGVGGFANDIAVLGGAVWVAWIGGRTTESGWWRLMSRLLWHVTEEILEGHETGSAAEDVMANLAFDVDHQFIEN